MGPYLQFGSTNPDESMSSSLQMGPAIGWATCYFISKVTPLGGVTFWVSLGGPLRVIQGGVTWGSLSATSAFEQHLGNTEWYSHQVIQSVPLKGCLVSHVHVPSALICTHFGSLEGLPAICAHLQRLRLTCTFWTSHLYIYFLLKLRLLIGK